MSVIRKFSVLAAAGIASLGLTLANAGGPDNYKPKPVFNPYVYGEIDLGYGYSDWATFQSVGPAFSNFMATAPTSNRRGGFAIGGAIGYAPIRYLSAEVGGFYLARVSSGGGPAVNNWFIYAGPKVIVPIWSGVNVFAKVGVGYRAMTWTGAPNGNYWTPVYGAGGQYNINDSFYIIAQWMRIPGYTNTLVVASRAPSVDLFTAGAGYMFQV